MKPSYTIVTPSVSHVGRKFGPKTCFCARPWKDERGTTVTRSIQKCKIRIKRIVGSRVDTAPTAWSLCAHVRHVWNLSWTEEEAIKKGIPILKKAGFESVQDLPRTDVGFTSKAYKDLLPQLNLHATSEPQALLQMRIRICYHSSGYLQRRMVSKESECLYPMRKDSTAPPIFLCRRT